MTGGEMFVIGVIVGMIGASLILVVSFALSGKNEAHPTDLGPWIITTEHAGSSQVDGVIQILDDHRVRINDEQGYLLHLFYGVIKIQRVQFRETS